MIRPTTADDVPVLIELARETGVFKSREIDTLREVLDAYLAKPGGDGYFCATCEQDGRVLGFTIYGPNPMTDRTWDLYWIAVTRPAQGVGIGTELLRFVEDDIRSRGGRLLLIETSSLPHYGPTRRFYLKHGYEQAATVADFYADGDALVIFRKRLR